MTEDEHRIMRFESRWWRLAGSKDTAIRDELDLTPTRYYQLLHQLITRPDVHAAYPVLVNGWDAGRHGSLDHGHRIFICRQCDTIMPWKSNSSLK